LAFGAAIAWGAADFFAGTLSRTVSALVVLWASQWVGLAVVFVGVVIHGLALPDGAGLAYAAGSGAALTVMLGALYRAMAIGAIAVVAPIAATGTVIPVAVGLASGDHPTMIQTAGLIAAAAGVVLCSREADPSRRSQGVGLASGVGLAVLAALGSGLHTTLLASASSAGIPWVLLVQRTVVGTLALTVVLRMRQHPAPPRRALVPIIVIGVLDLAATGAFVAATTVSALSLVAVVGALYPVVTVILALTVLSERLETHQTVGTVAALVGVLAIAGG